MTFGKFLLFAVLAVVGGLIAINLAAFLLKLAFFAVLKIAVPVALLVGIVYIVYRMTGPKSLSGRDRGVLP